MIHQVRSCPPDAIPMRAAEIPPSLFPTTYIAQAEARGYRVLECRGRFYLARVH